MTLCDIVPGRCMPLAALSCSVLPDVIQVFSRWTVQLDRQRHQLLLLPQSQVERRRPFGAVCWRRLSVWQLDSCLDVRQMWLQSLQLLGLKCAVHWVDIVAFLLFFEQLGNAALICYRVAWHETCAAAGDVAGGARGCSGSARRRRSWAWHPSLLPFRHVTYREAHL